MAVDYQTDKLIVVRYPGYCGGKFLINSLGLSDGAVFQHSWCADQQLLGHFTPADKIEYILREIKDIKEIHKEWTDLFLGCYQMFGVFTENQTLDTIWDPVISKVIDSGKYFFIVAHDKDSYTRIKRIWTGARTLEIVNCESFIPLVRPNNCPARYETTEGADYTWDASWFLDEEKTVSNIKELYSELYLLGDFNEEYIRQYYQAWRSTISMV